MLWSNPAGTPAGNPTGTPRTLIAVPVYNEVRTAERVLRAIRAHAEHVLVIDDGSTDGTSELLDALAPRLGLDIIRHEGNAGYGHSLVNAFRRAHAKKFDWLITMDCDEQHEPASIPAFLAAAQRDDLDIISGSRYMSDGLPRVGEAPADRRAINKTITAEINSRLGPLLGGGLTDAFCGFKAHRVSALPLLRLTDNGYAFPMQFWVQIAANGLRVGELPVRLIYNDPNRTFGSGLDDAAVRLAHYRSVLHTELCRCADRLPASATADLIVPCGCAGK